MTLNKDRIDTLKYWLRKASIYLLKWILKIVIVVSIGALISYLIYRNTEFLFGEVLRIVGVGIACIGLMTQIGESNIRKDYNFNMQKIRYTKLINIEHGSDLTTSNISFLLLMGISGIILFIIGHSLL